MVFLEQRYRQRRRRISADLFNLGMIHITGKNMRPVA